VIRTSSVVLYELVERGQFPVDLYYRLNIVVLTDDRYALSDQAPSS
jgi:transcriptional regulator of aromatic amino acid metabolism